MVFTVFDFHFLILQSQEDLNRWLRHNKLLIDFIDLKCICHSTYKQTKDSSYPEGFCWKCSQCKTKFSLKKGSWFENSKLSVQSILTLTFFWVNDFSNKQCVLHAQVSPKTVVDWYNFCREVCLVILEQDQHQVIGGPGVIVEIDESKFGKRKYHKGKRVDGVWVFGGIERDNKANCFFFVLEDRSADTLIPLILDHIRPGSIIISDLWKGYSRLSFLGYEHLTVNHKKEFKNPITGAHTNHIETTWHSLKIMKRKSGLAKSLIASYFAEFIYRRKFLQHEENPFLTFIEKGITKVYTSEKALQAIHSKHRDIQQSQPSTFEPPSNPISSQLNSTLGDSSSETGSIPPSQSKPVIAKKRVSILSFDPSKNVPSGSKRKVAKLDLFQPGPSTSTLITAPITPLNKEPEIIQQNSQDLFQEPEIIQQISEDSLDSFQLSMDNDSDIYRVNFSLGQLTDFDSDDDKINELEQPAPSLDSDSEDSLAPYIEQISELEQLQDINQLEQPAPSLDSDSEDSLAPYIEDITELEQLAPYLDDL